MKKKLSLVLALSMMLTLVPMSAFAGSDNRVNRPVDVKNDENLKLVGAPILKVENDDGDWKSEERITLTLDNSDWLSKGDDKDSSNTFDDVDEFETLLASAIEDGTETVKDSVYGVKATVNRRSDSRVEITLKSTKNGAETDANIEKDIIVHIPMWVAMDGEVGKVNVKSTSRLITDGTYTFANGRSGDTKVYIDDTTNFSNTSRMETIVIEENTIKAIDVSKIKTGYIKLKVDKDFRFVLDEETKVYGDLVTANEVALGNTEDEAVANIVKLDDNELEIYVKGTKFEASADQTAARGIQLKDSGNFIGKLELAGLQIKPTNDAKEGKVKLTVSSDISEIKTATFEIGEYADYKMEVKADGDAKEVFSGRYAVDYDSAEFKVAKEKLTTDEDHELQTLILEEKVEGSWVNTKSVVVTFPSWVKILSVDEEGDEGDKIVNQSIDENEYEFEIDKDVDGKKKVELTFYVSTEAGKSGDIEAKVNGRALDEEYEVVLGKAIAPVEVKTESAKIKAGVRNQEIGKITLTEAANEAIKENADIVVELDKDMEWDDEPTVKVVKGDLEIDEDVEIKDNILTIHIEDESTTPSVIEITDGRIKVDRSIAEGKIDVEIKGDALIQNGYDKETFKGIKNADGSKSLKKSDLTEDYGIFTNDYYVEVEVANVITPADQNTQSAEAAKFVIGNAEFMVGDKVMTADVAPYIKDGRTMLSLSFVAQAMGVDSKNIMWDGTTRTVTIFKGDRIAQVQIGSAKMMVNGTPVMMDTAAEIKDGRTMLPVSYVAKALGANVAWDGATRTVTIK